MNVIVANDRKDALSNLDIEVIKSINGEYDVDELVAMFKDFFFDRMILDITAIKNYNNISNIQKIAMELGEDKIILVLTDELCTSSSYLSNIISMGIYNFTNNINAIKQLLARPNTYKDVAKIQQLNQNSIDASNRTGKSNKIIGIKNLTDHAGATTLTYMLKKELTSIYGNVVYAIEVNKRDFSYFNEKNMFSVSEMELGRKISELQKEQIEKSEYPVVGAKYNNEYKNLDEVVSSDGKIELIDINSKEGIKIYRRTLTYIMGKAFWHTYPEAHVIVNYQLSNAMYCDIENVEVTDEMIEKVKAKMQEIINQDLKIEKRVMTRDEAEKFYKETNSPKGRLQFDLEDRQNINMYYCDEYYNYIYETIATHTGATKVFDLQKYSKGFLLRYPSTKNVNELPEFHETKKLLWALQEYETIYKVLNVGTVYRLNKAVKENTIKYLILLSNETVSE